MSLNKTSNDKAMHKIIVAMMSLLLALLMVLTYAAPAGGAAQQGYRLSSPYHTLHTHLHNLKDDTYKPDIAATVFDPEVVSKEQAERLAVSLLRIYRGAGIAIDLESVPRSENYTDSTGNHRYQVSKSYPEIYLEKKRGNWYYSENTVEVIPGLYSRIYPFGIDRLINILPRLGTKSFLGIHIWQYIGILILIALCVVLQQFFFLLFEKLIIGFLLRRGHVAIVKAYVAPVARPISILLLFPILMLLVPVLQLPINLSSWILLTLKVAWPVFATIVFYRLADLLGHYMLRFAERTDNTLDDQLVPLARKTLKVFVLIVGGLAILANLDIDIIPLLTGLSIGGLAFALAAQDTLKNFFGSLMIFADKPFQVGDWITSGEIDGTVEEVGFRATRIRTFRNSVTYVPNGFIANTTVDNHGLRNYRRYYTKISITYDTPPHLISAFVDGLRELVEAHPHTRKDYYNIYLNDLASDALHVMFYIFFVVPTWPEELRCRHEIIIEVIRLAETLGVRFAFPTQTLHVESFPEKKSLMPDTYLNAGNAGNRIKKYMEEKKAWDRRSE
jgi:MscS family membrane protein